MSFHIETDHLSMCDAAIRARSHPANGAPQLYCSEVQPCQASGERRKSALLTLRMQLEFAEPTQAAVKQKRNYGE